MNQVLETKLREVISLAENHLERSDFEAAFKSLVDFIKRVEQKLTNLVEQKFQEADSRVNQRIENPSYLSDIQKRTLGQASELNNHVLGRLSKADERLAELTAYKLPDVPSVVAEASRKAKDALLPLLPKEVVLEDELPLLGKDIRDGLKALKDDERLPISAIKDLEEELKKLRKLIGNTSMVLGGAGNRRETKRYSLSSQLNGATKTFNLPAFYSVVDVRSSSLAAFEPTTDYTVDGSAHTITFTDAIDAGTVLSAGQTLLVIYND